MPSKVNAIATGSAGFLKPTYSSLSKANDKARRKPTDHWKKDQNNLKTKVFSKQFEGKTRSKFADVDSHMDLPPVCLSTIAQQSPLHSCASTTEQRVPSNSVGNALRINSVNQEFAKDDPNTKYPTNLPNSEAMPTNIPETNGENEIKIQDARRACDELRQQIEDLKMQQEAFQSRLSGEFELLNLSDSNPKKEIVSMNGKRNEKVVIDSINCQPSVKKSEKIEFVNKSSLPFSAVSKTYNYEYVEIPKTDDGNSSVTEDGFNLHGSVTSSDVTEFTVKEEWLNSRGLTKDVPPSKVIKRLLSERERYKKKVKHLQTALHRLKKLKTNPIFRTPDIAAHDIVYFNAELIGEGYLSYVYSGTIYKNQKAAVKKLVRPDMISTSDRSYLAAEAGLLMSLHHQNIVEVFGVCTAPLQPLILTELVTGKNLHARLHASDGWPLSPVEYYSTVRDVAVGMAYLHGQKPPVLHLNLRPCNVLVDSTGRAKVSDFGFSKIRLDAGISNRINLAYLAPELLCVPVHLTTKLDVFSYAVIMWEMATMSVPYHSYKASEILDIVSSGKRPSIPCELPSGFHAIMSRSWDQSPMQRPSFKELIILLETMSLPQEWEDAIKRSGLNRTDTKGLITPRDDRNKNSKAESTGFPMPTLSSQGKFSERGHQSIHQFSKPGMKKLSEELALESDMITHGYILPKLERQDSENYLRGFKSSPVFAPSRSPSSNHWKSPQSGHQQSYMSRLSPYKYNFVNHTPLVSPYHAKSSNYDVGVAVRNPTSVENGLVYKAVRNLDSELAVQSKDGTSDKDKNRGYGGSGKGGKSKRHPTDQYRLRVNGNADGRKRGSQSSSETDTSVDGPNADAPIPLDDRHFRYHDQEVTVETPKMITSRRSRNHTRSRPAELEQQSPRSMEDLRAAVSIPYLKYHDQEVTVETPKIITSRRSRNHIRSRPVELEQQSPRSMEDLRAAVSIPYLKNLRSGDEISSASGDQTARSHFDEKLSSYVSQACQAESRNYVDAKMKGWCSERSAILNQEPIVRPDSIKVHSVTSTAANHSLGDGGRRIASSALSDSPETVMTAQFKPDEAKRSELHHGQGTKYDGIISPTLSDKSLDETRRIGVISIPSTSGTRTTSHKPRHSSGGPLIRQSSDGKKVGPNPHGTNQHRFLRRENSWNKLKNSYSPEPLIPHFASPFSTTPCAGNIPLPPTLSSSETKESAFTRLPPNPSHLAVKPKRRHQAVKRNHNFLQAPVAKDAGHVDEVDQTSDSTLSSAINDDVGDALSDTAKELTGVSGILENAADKHRQSLQKKSRGKKSKK